MAEEVKRLKDVRTAYKGHCTRNMQKADGIIGSTEPNLDELDDILEAMSLRRAKISEVDALIEKSVDTTEIDKEIQGTLEYQDTDVIRK